MGLKYSSVVESVLSIQEAPGSIPCTKKPPSYSLFNKIRDKGKIVSAGY
jgi:hypothetical protein